MKYLFCFLSLMLTLAGCGGGGGEDDITLSKSVIEFNGSWSPGYQDPQELPFTVTHASGMKAYVNAPEKNNNKIVVFHEGTNGETTSFRVRAYLQNIEAGEQHFPVVVQLVDGDKKIVSTKELDIVVRLKDTLSVSIFSDSSTIYSRYNEPAEFSFANLRFESSQLDYQITENSGLLSLSATTGKGSSSVIARYKPVADKVGKFTSTVTATNAAQNISKSIDLTVDVERPRWTFERPGFLFSKLADSTFLTSTMRLVHTSNMPTNTFTATSSANWLQVTVAGDQLTAVADPRGLAAGTYVTNVTVKSTNIAEVPEQQLAVTLYVNPEVSKNNIVSIPLYSTYSTTHYLNIGPYIVTLVNDKLSFINIFSGDIEKTIELTGKQFYPRYSIPTISKDGRFIQLFVNVDNSYEALRYDWQNNQWLKGEKVGGLSAYSNGYIYDLDLVQVVGDQVLDTGKLLYHYNYTGAKSFDRDTHNYFDNDKVTTLTMKALDNNLYQYTYQVIDVALIKSVGVVQYKSLLNKGEFTASYHAYRPFSNGFHEFYDYNSKLARLIKFNSSGPTTEYLIQPFDPLFEDLCSIDDKNLYRISVDPENRQKVSIQKTDMNGNVIVSREDTLEYFDSIMGCDNKLENQRLILEIGNGDVKQLKIVASN